MTNPFFDRLDWSFQGKYCRVYAQDRVYHGWVEVLHHNRGSVILHNAEDVTGGEDNRHLGSVFVRVCEHIEVLQSHKRIQPLSVSQVVDSPYLTTDSTPTDYHMRRAYRNGFAGSFPVVRPVGTDEDGQQQYELINGHKRVKAMRAVGLERHPFEIFECDDETAKELVALAHRDAEHDNDIVDADQAELTDVAEEDDDAGE